MLNIAIITYKAFGKVRSRDFVFPNFSNFFGDYDAIKNLCLNDMLCDDFSILNIKFKKVEVFQ